MMVPSERVPCHAKNAVSATVPSIYSGWTDPVVALRDALRRDPARVEEARVAWTSWLRERGVATSWPRRLAVGDPRAGAVVVSERAYEYPAARPRVYGEIDDPHRDASLVLRSGGARYWRTSHATVVGGWDVVQTPDGACWPAVSPRTEAVLVSNALDARLLGWTPSLMIVRADRRHPFRRPLLSITRAAPRRVDRAIALVGEHSAQYGHFLLDYLPRALAAEHVPLSVPVLIDKGVSSNSIWWLKRVLPNRPIISVESGQAVEVRDLFVPLQRTFCPTGWVDPMELTPGVWSSDPTSVSRIQQVVTADVEVAPRRRSVWLGKRGGNKALVNQRELFECMAAQGFELVYPEDLSMRRLQTLLSETQDVIAPIGSQLLNVMASPPGLRVLVLLGGEMVQVRASTAVSVTSSGHELALVGGTDVGPPGRNPYERKQRSYVVSPELLKIACSSFFGYGA